MRNLLGALVVTLSLMGLGVGVVTLTGCSNKQTQESCEMCNSPAAECKCEKAENCEACNMAMADCKCEKADMCAACNMAMAECKCEK